jgi:hypothetical protein
LPLLVRGIYVDGWRPLPETSRERKREEFLAHVRERLRGIPLRLSTSRSLGCQEERNDGFRR